jgi:flotillin
MDEFAKEYQNVGNVTLVGGDTAGTRIAREQAAGRAATFDRVKSAKGVDLGAIFHGQVCSRGIALADSSQKRESSSAVRG